MKKKKLKDQCLVPECSRNIHIKKHQLCKVHVERFYKFGDPGGPIATKKMHKPYWPLVLKGSHK